ncbi:hypothetical protein B0181_11035 [Moraxella caviae]|uniref:Uncharacterized protein n=1 Tax=Moraxella caviae TaxID=34060 RepID=A0A1S9ZUB2_9GAMM|nr:hypothetical protein [Moraxella caviae]OOR87102.1 hypothetical protein B0181_11035 [Moraxella caviae]STZ13632.1 Uncharacterised protein [Moraxella caviae]
MNTEQVKDLTLEAALASFQAATMPSLEVQDWDDVDVDDEDPMAVMVLEVSAEYAESVGAEAADEDDFATHGDWEAIEGEEE